ncbi:MAG: glycosyltransferase family 9 protein [Anaerolineae bacterium]|nr:glycosyltransferase family 9 protein [Anaerolineae bacterium]
MKRLLLVLPCCIGDVVLATATLTALRRAYPQAHITWAVGTWSRGVIEQHPALDAVLDTGEAALPVKSVGGFLHFVRQVRAGHFDAVVSLVRSPLMSAALRLTGIPVRAGLDSNGRGFGYTHRAPVNPRERRHEAEIYLSAAAALGLDTTGCYANIPVLDSDRAAIRQRLDQPYWVVNPAGGRNPGMTLDLKRWPPQHFAALIERLSPRLRAAPVLLGGPADGPILEAVAAHLRTKPLLIAGGLSFGEIAALAAGSVFYLGNDTGLTHLAAAAGARTAMIFGPSDPMRYAPFTPDSLALWKPSAVEAGGVWAGVPAGWSWERDGIGVDETEIRLCEWLHL